MREGFHPELFPLDDQAGDESPIMVSPMEVSVLPHGGFVMEVSFTSSMANQPDTMQQINSELVSVDNAIDTIQD